MTLGIDELNVPSIEEEVKQYFSVMDISEEQKEEREEAAKDLFPIFLFLFALLEYAVEYDLPYEYVINEFRIQFGSVAYQYYDDASEYIDRITEDVLNATLKDIVPLTLKDGEHWLSPERALELSENEANSLLNYQELKQAIEDGYTHKTWVTERDNRVRDDHRDKYGETIPIAEYFKFPDCEMLCPHDVVNGTAKQVSRCRCSLKYSRNDEEYRYTNEGISGILNTGRKVIDGVKRRIVEFAHDNRGSIQFSSYDPARNRAILMGKINSGEYPMKLKPRQSVHIIGGQGNTPTKSVVTLTKEEIVDLVNTYHGTGDAYIMKDGSIKEVCKANKVIGYTVDKYTGENTGYTTRFSIHYSKDGYHIVPTGEKK